MSDEEIETLEQNIQLLRAADPSKDAECPHRVFQLAAALISHRDKGLVQEGLGLMEALAFHCWKSKAAPSAVAAHESGSGPHKKDAPDDMLHCYYYYITIAQIKLGELRKARSSVENMLERNPNNMQGLELLRYIDRKLTQSGVLGLVAVTAGVAIVGAAIGLLRRR